MNRIGETPLKKMVTPGFSYWIKEIFLSCIRFLQYHAGFYLIRITCVSRMDVRKMGL